MLKYTENVIPAGSCILSAPAPSWGWVFFMSRIAFLVDGFNIYHALDCSRPLHKYKWLNFARLARCYVTQKDTIQEVVYFTTLLTWDPGKTVRHKLLIRANENAGVRVVFGKFKRRDVHCRLRGGVFTKPEEKQTDVNIAIELLRLAVADRYDKAILISGDTDLLPAVKAVQTTFPGKQIGVVLPIGRASEELKENADFHYRMKEKHLASSRFADTIALPDGSSLTCPSAWR